MVGVAESLFEETEGNLARGVVLPELVLTGDCFTSSGGYALPAFLRTGVPGGSEEPVLSILSDLVDFSLVFPNAHTDTRCISYFQLNFARNTHWNQLPFGANLSDAVEDRLESVAADDVDGRNVGLAGVLLIGSTTSTESSSDSLSDDSMVSACIRVYVRIVCQKKKKN